jgi:hypothetical protein
VDRAVQARSPPRVSRCRTVLPCWPAMGWSRQCAKRGVTSAPSGVGERHDDLSCRDRADAAALGQPGSHLIHDGLQLSPVGHQGPCSELPIRRSHRPGPARPVSNKLSTTPPTDGSTTMDSPGGSYAADRPRYVGRASLIRQRSVVQVHLGSTRTNPTPTRSDGLGPPSRHASAEGPRGQAGLTTGPSVAARPRRRRPDRLHRVGRPAGRPPRPHRPRTVRRTGSV